MLSLVVRSLSCRWLKPGSVRSNQKRTLWTSTLMRVPLLIASDHHRNCDSFGVKSARRSAAASACELERSASRGASGRRRGACAGAWCRPCASLVRSLLGCLLEIPLELPGVEATHRLLLLAARGLAAPGPPGLASVAALGSPRSILIPTSRLLSPALVRNIGTLACPSIGHADLPSRGRLPTASPQYEQGV